VNAVAPGIIFSPTARDNYAVDVFSMAEPYIPAKRLGTPEEVRPVLYNYFRRFSLFHFSRKKLRFYST
jgi:NAD(P)-dependent dehydrogenase (short-subunit alcohol dehydrogenase family)